MSSDETDMTLDDLKARLVQAEPVEIVDGPPGEFASDFYEEDEPIEKILAIFERGPDGVTAPPD